MPKGFAVLFFSLAALTVSLLFLLPGQANAQCGSSASSCKNCHEIKAQDPVNNEGAWHTAHAFGDFCEFCHAGNVQATDKAAAHVGLINPLADVQGSCQSCHPNDYNDRAVKYAEALGKPLGTGTAPAVGVPVAAGATAAEGSAAECGPVAPTGGTLIDLNQLYAERDSSPPVNFGNFVLLGLIGATGLALFGMVLHYDRPLPRVLNAAQGLLYPMLTAPSPQGSQEARLDSQLASALAASDPATRRAITQLLADREHGPQVLQALSQMDLGALTALGEGDQKALAALLALVKEMNK